MAEIEKKMTIVATAEIKIAIETEKRGGAAAVGVNQETDTENDEGVVIVEIETEVPIKKVVRHRAGENPPCTGMFRHRDLNILLRCSTRLCKQQDKFPHPWLLKHLKQQSRW